MPFHNFLITPDTNSPVASMGTVNGSPQEIEAARDSSRLGLTAVINDLQGPLAAVAARIKPPEENADVNSPMYLPGGDSNDIAYTWSATPANVNQYALDGPEGTRQSPLQVACFFLPEKQDALNEFLMKGAPTTPPSYYIIGMEILQNVGSQGTVMALVRYTKVMYKRLRPESEPKKVDSTIPAN